MGSGKRDRKRGGGGGGGSRRRGGEAGAAAAAVAVACPREKRERKAKEKGLLAAEAALAADPPPKRSRRSRSGQRSRSRAARPARKVTGDGGAAAALFGVDGESEPCGSPPPPSWARRAPTKVPRHHPNQDRVEREADDAAVASVKSPSIFDRLPKDPSLTETAQAFVSVLDEMVDDMAAQPGGYVGSEFLGAFTGKVQAGISRTTNMIKKNSTEWSRLQDQLARDAAAMREDRENVISKLLQETETGFDALKSSLSVMQDKLVDMARLYGAG